MRMRRKPCHDGLAQLAKVVREAGHFGAVHPGVDEQHASPAMHDNGVALAELALVDQHTLRDLPQHGGNATVPSARQQRFAQRLRDDHARPSGATVSAVADDDSRKPGSIARP